MSQEVNGFVVVAVVIPFSSYCILFYPNSIDPIFQIFVYHLCLPLRIPALHINPTLKQVNIHISQLINK